MLLLLHSVSLSYYAVRQTIINKKNCLEPDLALVYSLQIKIKNGLSRKFLNVFQPTQKHGTFVLTIKFKKLLLKESTFMLITILFINCSIWLLKDLVL